MNSENIKNVMSIDDLDLAIIKLREQNDKFAEKGNLIESSPKLKSKNQIILQISGGEKSGKSTLARLLAAFCHQNGFEYELDDSDGGNEFPSLKEISNQVKEKTKIFIRTENQYSVPKVLWNTKPKTKSLNSFSAGEVGYTSYAEPPHAIMVDDQFKAEIRAGYSEPVPLMADGAPYQFIEKITDYPEPPMPMPPIVSSSSIATDKLHNFYDEDAIAYQAQKIGISQAELQKIINKTRDNTIKNNVVLGRTLKSLPDDDDQF